MSLATTTTAKSSLIPDVRRVVTGHSSDGKSTIVADDICAPRYVVPGGTRFYDLFLTEEFPASNSGEFVDKVKDRPSDVVSKGGSTFKIVDIPPGTVIVRIYEVVHE